MKEKKKRQSGQGMTEYSLILACIAVVVIVVLGLAGKNINNTFSTINNSLAADVSGAGEFHNNAAVTVTETVISSSNPYSFKCRVTIASGTSTPAPQGGCRLMLNGTFVDTTHALSTVSSTSSEVVISYTLPSGSWSVQVWYSGYSDSPTWAGNYADGVSTATNITVP